MNSKEKGNLLEDIIAQLCSGVKNARITKNAKIIGKKTRNEREIDVLIRGKVGAFDVCIAIESKNYKKPVGIEKVESFKAKLDDIGADLGAMVCPTGFTVSAKNCATFDGIKLFEVIDPKLGNSNLFIPIRYVEPEIRAFSFRIVHRTIGPISIPQDISRWRFHVGDEILDANQLVRYAWNKNMIPQEAGSHVANFNAMTMSDTREPDKVQYCEISINIDVVDNYYLRLMPASFLRNSEDGKEHFNLRVDIRSKKDEMLRIGWKKFDSLEEMNRAADIENQPKGVRDILLKPSYTIDVRQAKNSKK